MTRITEVAGDELPTITELPGIAGRASPAGATDSSIERKRSLLNDAIQACTGERHRDYGLAKANFEKVTRLWDAWLEIRKSGPLEPWEVAVFMNLMKLARLAHTPTSRFLARHCRLCSLRC
jgi:Domain of unknown function (DUF6378)